MSKVLIQSAKSTRQAVDNMQRTHKREMQAIESQHQARKADMKVHQEDTIIELQEENHKQVMTEAQKKEKVLEGMRKGLDNSRTMTDRQLKHLHETEVQKTEQIRTKTSLDRDRITAENEEHLKLINDDFNSKAREIRYEGQNGLSRMDDTEKQKYSELRDHHTMKVSEQTMDFNKRYTTDERKYTEFKDLQDKTFDKQRMHQVVKQQKDMSKLSKEQQYQLDQQQKLFLQGLKAQDEFEKEKWAGTMKVHTENFKNLDDMHKKVVSQVKTDMTKEVSQIVKRSDDKFYQFTELNPKLTQFPDRVEISVDVPDHSKQDLQLTTNNKEVVVVYNRRFQDTNKNQLGSAKINRIESFTSRINVDDHLDPKTVKSTYENGTMTYVIKKA